MSTKFYIIPFHNFLIKEVLIFCRYKISAEVIKTNNGSGVLSKHGNSPLKLLQRAYPNHKFIPHNFSSAPKHHWQNVKNIRELLLEAMKEMGMKRMEEWYGVTSEAMIKKMGRGGLLAKYNKSMSRMLSSAFPEHKWEWKVYRSLPSLESAEERREFVMMLQKKMEIKEMEDWLRISKDEMQRWVPVLPKKWNIKKMLREVYPEHCWDESNDEENRAASLMKSSQRSLVTKVRELFPLSIVKENWRSEEVIGKGSGRNLEIDVYLPAERIGFEYQGQQHYGDIFAFGKRPKERDTEKRRECEEAGITLIAVPYWWDRTLVGLRETIREKRPDLKINDE